jgi:bidirectional [NiFe] hydrogenase diaphorase subunit
MYMPTAPTRSQKPAAHGQAEHPSGDSRFKIIDRTLKRFQYQQDALIEVLHSAQESFGFLSDDLMIYVAHQLKLPLSWVYGVATFYHFFSLKPQGEHNCTICLGTACYVKNAAELVTAMRQAYGIEAGQMTSDQRLSLSTARCLGSCGLAPVVLMDGKVMGRALSTTLLAEVQNALNAGTSTVAEPAGEQASPAAATQNESAKQDHKVSNP